jgi:hypothetical protein
LVDIARTRAADECLSCRTHHSRLSRHVVANVCCGETRQDAPHVSINGGNGFAKGYRGHGGRRVVPNAGERSPFGKGCRKPSLAEGTNLLGCTVQPLGALVVA